jgi:hypothetical protein
MWSSRVKRKGTTQVMYNAKLKDCPKELRKLSQRFWKGFLKWCDGGEKMESHQKEDFEVEVFFSS